MNEYRKDRKLGFFIYCILFIEVIFILFYYYFYIYLVFFFWLSSVSHTQCQLLGKHGKF